MTENLTESFALWPFAPWLMLAGLAVVVELYRRDGRALIAFVGCLVAAAVAVVAKEEFGWQFLAFAVGAVATWGFAPAGRTAE